MYTKYQYKNIEWVGTPGLDYSDCDITQIPIDLRSGHGDVDVDFFTEPLKDKKYVISSTYMSQETVPTIFGPPRSYSDCFTQIMEYVCDEIEVCKGGDASDAVKCCLECHTICPYIGR